MPFNETDMPPSESDGWEVYSKHVLFELRRLARNQEDILRGLSAIQAALPNKVDSVKLEELRVEADKRQFEASAEIAALKVKAGIWGVVGAAIPTSVWILYEIVSKVLRMSP